EELFGLVAVVHRHSLNVLGLLHRGGSRPDDGDARDVGLAAEDARDNDAAEDEEQRDDRRDDERLRPQLRADLPLGDEARCAPESDALSRVTHAASFCSGSLVTVVASTTMSRKISPRVGRTGLKLVTLPRSSAR